METALMITLAQIVDGDEKCAYCELGATMTVANGADPEPEPVCYTHAMNFYTAAAAFAGQYLKTVA